MAVSTSPRNVTLMDQAGIFWWNTSTIICHTCPLHPLEWKKNLHDKNFKNRKNIKNQVFRYIEQYTFKTPPCPCALLKRCQSSQGILFRLLITPLPHSSFYINLPVCIGLQSSLLVARWGTAWWVTYFIKPTTSSNFLSWIFFNTLKTIYRFNAISIKIPVSFLQN